ncbi:EAL domain-containing protein [Gallaecimonas sp. GXIMD4217]|uniref:EAL domain-containing response regulator n=1 Tax=Gallaecimonas sp. GXIMD4217 TaxID=3131927 RepID=UPI00311AEFB9
MTRRHQLTRVLVVDDDATTRLMMEESLDDLGMVVDTAASGDGLLDRLAGQMPDLILLDVNLPGQNGFELCEAIRDAPGGAQVPIVMITGKDDLASIHQAFENGATDFIAKPINWDLLPFRVRYLLRNSQFYKDLCTNRQQLINTKKVARIADWSWDLSQGQGYWSPELYRLLELPLNSPVGSQHQLLDHVYDEDRDRVADVLERLFNEHQPYDIEYRLFRGEGETCLYVQERSLVINDEQGHPQFIIGTIQDISQRKEFEAEIHFLACHDSLTGFLNRAAFRERLEAAMARANRHGYGLPVLFFDLDDFKAVNDRLGHDTGDRLLKAIAQRMKAVLRRYDELGRTGTAKRSEDSAGRWGGDEFVALLDMAADPKDLVRICRRLLDSIQAPVDLGSQALQINASIGIALYPQDADTAAGLIGAADKAMYAAKSAGKGRFAFANPRLHDQANRYLQMEAKLHEAIAGDELRLFYEPVVELATGRTVGMEARLRWQLDRDEALSPHEFWDVACQSHLRHDIESWVLAKAASQARQWQQQGREHWLSINLSQAQLLHRDFLGHLDQLLASLDLNPHRLRFELPESALERSSEELRQAIDELRARGCGFYIEGFGLGQLSLHHLGQYGVDGLKVAREIVAALGRGQAEFNLLKGIVAMGLSLDLDVVAVGVDDAAQQAALQGLDGLLVQGLQFGPPQPLDEGVQAGSCS